MICTSNCKFLCLHTGGSRGGLSARLRLPREEPAAAISTRGDTIGLSGFRDYDPNNSLLCDFNSKTAVHLRILESAVLPPGSELKMEAEDGEGNHAGDKGDPHAGAADDVLEGLGIAL